MASSDCALPPNPTSANRLPLIRWVALSALLLVELIGLGLRFDTGSLAPNLGWWAELLGQAHRIPQLLIVVAAAVLLLGGRRLGQNFREALESSPAGRTWPFLLAHLIALAGLVPLTAFVLEGGGPASPYFAAWTLAWFALAGLTLVLWFASVLPIRLWLLLARRSSGVLLPACVVGAAALVAALLSAQLWLPLSQGTFWGVRVLLGLVVSEPVCAPDAFLVGTPTFAVRIAPSCSGCEGIGLIVVFLSAYLWYARTELRFPSVLLLVPLAILFIWLANVVRIASLVLIGTWGYPGVALGGFHSQAGWLAFNAVSLGTVLLTRRLSLFRQRSAAAPCEGATDRASSTSAYLVPLLVLLVAIMVTAALSAGFDWFYPLRVVAVAAALLYFRRFYPGLFRPWSWAAVGIGGVVFLLWLVLEPDVGDADHAFADALRGVPRWGAASWLVFRVVGSVITVPAAEELAFRGYLTRRLIAADFEEAPAGQFTWPSFLVSSALFGLLHGRWLAGMLAGMLFAAALYHRRRLSDAVLAHATTNLLLAAYVLIAGRWSLWC